MIRAVSALATHSTALGVTYIDYATWQTQYKRMSGHYITSTSAPRVPTITDVESPETRGDTPCTSRLAPERRTTRPRAMLWVEAKSTAAHVDEGAACTHREHRPNNSSSRPTCGATARSVLAQREAR